MNDVTFLLSLNGSFVTECQFGIRYSGMTLSEANGHRHLHAGGGGVGRWRAAEGRRREDPATIAVAI